jgi:hypothetical protein
MKQAKKQQVQAAKEVLQDDETQVTQGDNDDDMVPAFNEIDKIE